MFIANQRECALSYFDTQREKGAWQPLQSRWVGGIECDKGSGAGSGLSSSASAKRWPACNLCTSQIQSSRCAYVCLSRWASLTTVSKQSTVPHSTVRNGSCPSSLISRAVSTNLRRTVRSLIKVTFSQEAFGPVRSCSGADV